MSRLRTIVGFHAVASLVRRAPEGIKHIYLDQARSDPRSRDLIELAQARGVRVIRVPGNRLDGIAKGARHQGLIAIAEAAEKSTTLEDLLEHSTELPLLLVLDGVQDPHNLGACLRVADAFGAQGVIAPKDRACPLTEAATKVASGAAETVPYLMVTNLVRTLGELKERGIWVMGAAQDASEEVTAAPLDGAIAWALGAEGKGLRRLTRDACDRLLRIPMFGAIESLNVSVAAAILLYETRRQRTIGKNR